MLSYRLLYTDILENEIGIAPAYQMITKTYALFNRPSATSIRYTDYLLSLPNLEKLQFQVLNRRVWTNIKAFKSRMKPGPQL